MITILACLFLLLTGTGLAVWWFWKEPTLSISEKKIFDRILADLMAIKFDRLAKDAERECRLAKWVPDSPDIWIFERTFTVERFGNFEDSIAWKVTLRGEDVSLSLGCRKGFTAMVRRISRKLWWHDRHGTGRKTAITVVDFQRVLSK